jgi:acetylornithine deacetylase/succinyl-diaminopimelate desuccinylase-like protein
VARVMMLASMMLASLLGPVVVLAAATAAPAAVPAPEAHLPSQAAAPIAAPAEQQVALAIMRELVEIDTTHDHGSTTVAAEAIARRLRAAGIPAGDIRILGPSPRKQNLVARLHGTGARPPLLLLGHLDVVEARREDWTLEPFHLTERDGYFYGRGTLDMKSQVAYWVAHFIRLKREARTLDRDVILALTADEEAGDENGVQWLLAHEPALVRAAYALNEAGNGEIKNGRRRANDIQASEKGYLSFRVEARNKGGHSSLPEKDNAIVQLARALAAVHAHAFDARVTDVTRAYFARMAALESAPVAADLRAIAAADPRRAPDAAATAHLASTTYYNARLRTTCVPTRVQGGHADNALPQLATAVVNCRLLPGDRPDQVKHALEQAIADPAVSVTQMGVIDIGPDSPLLPELFSAATAITERMWPGIPVLPVMSTGATDGRFLRAAGIPTYGVSGLFQDVDDIRAHGRDERIGVRAFYEGQEFTWRLLLAVATATANATAR